MDDKPNAPMTPREYVDLIAGPTLVDLLARRDDRRLAYLACLTVYHCVDALGLAEAARAPGFDAPAPSARRRAVDGATNDVRKDMADRCGHPFRVVHGIANGTKHPGKVPLLPGSERRFGMFGFGPGCAGFDEGRWSFPGLGLPIEGDIVFLDACAQQVLAAFICIYPAHLGGVALSFLDWGLTVPRLGLRPDCIKRILWWATMNPSVDEVWLTRCRANDTSTSESDIGLAIVLASDDQDRDRPDEDWTTAAERWEADLASHLDCSVSLEPFPHASEAGGMPGPRAGAILLWRWGSAGWERSRPDDGELE